MGWCWARENSWTGFSSATGGASVPDGGVEHDRSGQCLCLGSWLCATSVLIQWGRGADRIGDRRAVASARREARRCFVASPGHQPVSRIPLEVHSWAAHRSIGRETRSAWNGLGCCVARSWAIQPGFHSDPRFWVWASRPTEWFRSMKASCRKWAAHSLAAAKSTGSPPSNS